MPAAPTTPMTPRLTGDGTGGPSDARAGPHGSGAADPPAADLVLAEVRLLRRPQGDREAVPLGGAALPARRRHARDAHPLAAGRAPARADMETPTASG